MPRGRLLFYLTLTMLAVFVGYGVFEGRRIVEGPSLTILSPLDGSATSSTKVVISGRTSNIAFLSLNGKESYTDSRGYFNETLSPPPGYTTVSITARDRFGRQVARTIHFTVRNYCSLT